MAAPIELRMYLRRFTLDDARAGVAPIRQQVAPDRVELFSPAVLQFRYREKVDGELRWSEFTDVKYEREGDE